MLYDPSITGDGPRLSRHSSLFRCRLRDLSRDSRLLPATSLAAAPLRLATRGSVALNFGDVTAVTAVVA
jgi:hypothetical protein